MAELNHLIVWARDQHASAEFVADLFGSGEPVLDPPFSAVRMENGVTLDFLTSTGPITAQHYAFLVSEEEFDRVMERIADRALPYWGGPGHSAPDQINRREGGRGVYFDDPDGHGFEAITRVYGSEQTAGR